MFVYTGIHHKQENRWHGWRTLLKENDQILLPKKRNEEMSLHSEHIPPLKIVQ